jgi:hypothetical protein
VFGALVAGISRMRWGTFILYNALGGAIWATAAVLVGYLLGGSLGIVEQWLGKASLLLGILAVLAVVLYLLYRWAANHPERLRGAFERLGGERIQRFLESRAGLWLRRRFSPRGAYGLALTAGLALVGLFSWAFGAVVQDVVARDPLVRVDVRILEFFHSHSEPALTAAVSVFEAVFSPEVLLSAGAVGGSALVFWRTGARISPGGSQVSCYSPQRSGQGRSPSSSSTCSTARLRPPRSGSSARPATAFRAPTQ